MDEYKSPCCNAAWKEIDPATTVTVCSECGQSMGAAECEALRSRCAALEAALREAQNVLLDYIPQIEAKGATLNYGRRVLAMIKEALEGQ
jgi:hypothetical protein